MMLGMRVRAKVRLGTGRGRWWSSEGAAGKKEKGKKRMAAAWGNGDFGRLGLGSLDSQWKPAPLLSSAFDNNDNDAVEAIACGGAHTLFLTNNGRLFATGLNDFGQLGLGTCHDHLNYAINPIPVPGIEKRIVRISAGYHHSCAITEDGELYMWGRNSNGQLGLGKRAPKLVPVPTKVECLAGLTIKMAALGSEHSLAVTDGGESLSWGGGSGRLGHSHESGILGIFKSTSEYTPRLIKKFEGTKVKKVAAGMLHSACIDENGSVYVFGERAVDKVGSGMGANTIAPASMISKLPRAEEVACGGYHTCVITSGGELYSWGSNENGCLGIGTTDVFHQPERVQGPFLRSPVVKVSCGWKHTAAISEGNIFTWGWGGSHGTFSEEEHSSGGQLGHGTDVDYIKPTKVTFGKNVKALQISCGFNHTGAIFECS